MTSRRRLHPPQAKTKPDQTPREPKVYSVPVGFCAVTTAHSPQDAYRRVRSALEKFEAITDLRIQFVGFEPLYRL
jgi:hypothetical protein